jgi:C-terminal processing protease CtpA/Prc
MGSPNGGGSGGGTELVGTVRLSAFNARAQVGGKVEVRPDSEGGEGGGGEGGEERECGRGVKPRQPQPPPQPPQSDVAAAIRRLEAAGAVRLVLDLRDNRGGLVTEGLEVARLFMGGEGKRGAGRRKRLFMRYAWDVRVWEVHAWEVFVEGRGPGGGKG